MKVCKDGHLGGQIHSQTFKKVKYFIAFHINLILIRLVLVYVGNMGRDILIPSEIKVQRVTVVVKEEFSAWRINIFLHPNWSYEVSVVNQAITHPIL